MLISINGVQEVVPMDNEEYLEWLEVHFETPIEQDYHQDTLHELMEFEFEEEL